MRKAGAIAALLACIAYAMLATWHAVLVQSLPLQATSAEAKLELALAASICHGGSIEPSAANVERDVASTQPADGPAPNGLGACPVCKGLASCHLYLIVTSGLVEFIRASTTIAYERSPQIASAENSIAPRSRGPPALA